VEEELARPEPSVVITRAPCVLLPEHRKIKRPGYAVDSAACRGCRACVGLGGPAVEWVPISREEAARRGREKQKGHSSINTVLCDGCGQCYQLCRFGAINPEGQ
jgi:indolepyruvate ferredoxin oxidoreductase alpha subunit